jgi:hypothetical protein
VLVKSVYCKFKDYLLVGQLYRRYPQLHVYAYGVLPCVDAVTADACASFITSVIYNDEFSSRLSVAAIMRLRVAALQALAADANTDSALLTKLTNQLFREGHRNESEKTVHTIQQEIVGQSRTNSSKGEGSAGEQNENPAREHVQWQRRKR